MAWMDQLVPLYVVGPFELCGNLLEREITSDFIGERKIEREKERKNGKKEEKREERKRREKRREKRSKKKEARKNK